MTNLLLIWIVWLRFDVHQEWLIQPPRSAKAKLIELSERCHSIIRVMT